MVVGADVLGDEWPISNNFPCELIELRVERTVSDGTDDERSVIVGKGSSRPFDKLGKVIQEGGFESIFSVRFLRLCWSSNADRTETHKTEDRHGGVKPSGWNREDGPVLSPATLPPGNDLSIESEHVSLGRSALEPPGHFSIDAALDLGRLCGKEAGKKFMMVRFQKVVADERHFPGLPRTPSQTDIQIVIVPNAKCRDPVDKPVGRIEFDRLGQVHKGSECGLLGWLTGLLLNLVSMNIIRHP